ncbi:MAG: MFS transporter [Flammeovirgaceae bacterium]
MEQKNNPRTLNAWAFYDWANSVYNLTITTAIFPIYFLSATEAAFDGEILDFFGMSIKNDVLYSYSVSFSFLIIVVLSPLLSGVADYSGRKKLFMQIFTYIGGFSCISLYFFTGENIEYGIIYFILASVGYAGALVFYNGFLPEIATPDRFDSISARGYSLGYLGSVILLIISIITIEMPQLFFDVDGRIQELIASGLAEAEATKEATAHFKLMATKLSFLCVGIWWVVFAQIPFFILKDKPVSHDIDRKHLFTKGFKELQKAWGNIKVMPTIKGFLGSFFFYSMGVQTVMVLAPLFGEKEIQLDTAAMIKLVLILQIIAIPGAYLFAWISKKKGNKFSLMTMLVLWVGICFGAFFTYTPNQFYILACFVGMSMGGIQSLSRSTYSKLLPKGTEDTASFFSFYDVTEKVAIVIGTASFGFISDISSMRDSALVLTVYFLLGIFVLYKTFIPFVKEENR